eukprot:COSAG05_NODE_2029_length_3670_cov_2.261831_5_plen_72_part_00
MVYVDHVRQLVIFTEDASCQTLACVQHRAQHTQPGEEFLAPQRMQLTFRVYGVRAREREPRTNASSININI